MVQTVECTKQQATFQDNFRMGSVKTATWDAYVIKSIVARTSPIRHAQYGFFPCPLSGSAGQDFSDRPIAIGCL
ncbi:unnamed protein product [Clavelina lepadiformis]|uniref:Uncharacterized protein n=1 Tax=Clavelina lepadiformis TaxID=159417 RepID=A0ABP0F2W1_CLALP